MKILFDISFHLQGIPAEFFLKKAIELSFEPLFHVVSAYGGGKKKITRLFLGRS